MSVLDISPPDFMEDEEIRIFADAASRFFDQKAPPERIARWCAAGQCEREFWNEAGGAGLLGVSVPEQYGGAGGDFRHDIVLTDLVARKEIAGFEIALHNGVVTPYIQAHGTEEQKQRWLPRLSNGELIAAIAMSEPAAGSDLQGIRTRATRGQDGYRITGQKAFISSGQLANLIVVVAKTDPSQGARGLSLLVVETDQADGFSRGRKLDKVGWDAHDTSELFFDDVLVPLDNLLGGVEGCGFSQLMKELPRERLLIAVSAMARIERALETTIAYVKERKAFGQTLLDFQNTQFKLAECKTDATVAKVFLNRCIARHLAGDADSKTSAIAKYWLTELENKIVDECVQLHGGYGYMNEYLIGRMYRDVRISRILGGSNEIMKVLIARSL